MITHHAERWLTSFRYGLCLAMSGLCFAAGVSGAAAAEQKASPPATGKPAATAAGPKDTGVNPAASSRKVLIFRNVRSWNRKMDFEEALTNAGFKFDVKPSGDMAQADLAPYGVVIIPGAQWRDDYYRDYADSAVRFDSYVTNGGTLVLELNGAERDGIVLPRGITMASHGATDNAISLPQHPILLPMEGRQIHANYASHGYLEGVPKDALILVTEIAGDAPDRERPTFAEYPSGKGRVLAACQCFHDQDKSGRGPLMDTILSYAVEREWYGQKK